MKLLSYYDNIGDFIRKSFLDMGITENDLTQLNEFLSTPISRKMNEYPNLKKIQSLSNLANEIKPITSAKVPVLGPGGEPITERRKYNRTGKFAGLAKKRKDRKKAAETIN